MRASARNNEIQVKRKFVDEQVQWLIISQHVIESKSVKVNILYFQKKLWIMTHLNVYFRSVVLLMNSMYCVHCFYGLNTIYGILQFFRQPRVVCQAWTSQVSWHQLLCMEMCIMLLWDRLMRSPSEHRSQTTGSNNIWCYIFLFHTFVSQLVFTVFDLWIWLRFTFFTLLMLPTAQLTWNVPKTS